MRPGPSDLTDPGTLLATTHAAGDGLRVRLRLARPSDATLVREFLQDLAPETRQRRFLHAMPIVSDAVVRGFTFFDPRRRLVVVAVLHFDGAERVVGIADVAHLETGLAELGVVVDDDLQGRGVGKLLTEVIASLAIKQGARQLKADLLEGNAAMLALLNRLGPTVSTVEHGTTVAHTRLPAARPRAA